MMALRKLVVSHRCPGERARTEDHPRHPGDAWREYKRLKKRGCAPTVREVAIPVLGRVKRRRRRRRR